MMSVLRGFSLDFKKEKLHIKLGGNSCRSVEKKIKGRKKTRFDKNILYA